MSSINNESNLPNPAALPPPPSIKPTSRARTYRIPNDSYHAAANSDNDNLVGGAGAAAVVSNCSSAPESSFLWATREIAALDFLMNIPLRSEKDIVRAGLSGGRWHRQHHHSRQINTAASTNLAFSSGVEVIEEEAVPAANQRHHLSNFDITRSSGIDEEAGTTTGTVESSFHTFSEHSKTHQATAAAGGGRWWDRLVLKDKRFFSAANQQAQRREQLEMEEKELERPTDSPSLAMMNTSVTNSNGFSDANGVSFGVTTDMQNKGINAASASTPSSAVAGVPGRRLDGRDAITVAIPEEFRRRPPPLRAAARQAAVREWEIRVAYGAQPGMKQQQPPNTTPRNALLDGRVFMSTKKSYPVAVFSTIKYEPKKEETLRRRKQIEEMGGGGTQFVLPERDWRGISYRALLPQGEKHNKAFNRLLGSTASKRPKKTKSPREDHYDNTSSSGEDNDDTDSMYSTDESDCGAYYSTGFLDDPQMVQGRNRNVMMGDKVTGPIISSTIQFVKPSVLKADLNKQFRERFDQWETPKSQRRYIGAKVIDGVYTLIDPTDTMQEEDDEHMGGHHRSGSLAVATEHEREKIRMPPSLTLSKIRSLKQQALAACVRARIEISSLALACVYFERLCLDCRVDKSNRRLSFAACLLLAVKVNESNSMIAYDRGVETKSDGSEQLAMTSWVKPNRKSGRIFESLIVFFTHDWALSLKQLYAAEWIVFTALGFSLKATPSDVAFHFKRLLRVLEWNPRSYLGSEMYRQWQASLVDESRQNDIRKARREARNRRNERKQLKLQRKLLLQQQSDAELTGRSSRRSSTTMSEGGSSLSVIPTRRHSMDSIPMPTYRVDQSLTSSGRTATSHQEMNTKSLDNSSPGRFPKREGVAIRGILSRLSRPKQASHTNLDKLPKLSEKKVNTMKQSASVPNLTSLNSRPKNFSIDTNIYESVNEDDEETATGLFL